MLNERLKLDGNKGAANVCLWSRWNQLEDGSSRPAIAVPSLTRERPLTPEADLQN